jgi:uncharacterized membrane-anchored protein YhcB (DUF1043 family)
MRQRPGLQGHGKDSPHVVDNATASTNSGIMTWSVSGTAVGVSFAWAGNQFEFSKRRQQMNAILLASAGVVIFLVGGGIGFWAGRSGIGRDTTRAEKAEAELEEYKRSVTEHFGQTAAHFQAIGKQYRELYEHMASGAQVLCEPDEAGKQRLFAPEPATEAASEQQAERADRGESTEMDTAGESVAEADSKPRQEAEVEDRTIH